MVQGIGIEWHVALSAVFVEGIIFMALAMTGIGLFLAIIGFKNVGLTVDHGAMLVNLKDSAVLLSLFLTPQFISVPALATAPALIV